jgi:hypothetical protein
LKVIGPIATIEAGEVRGVKHLTEHRHVLPEDSSHLALRDEDEDIPTEAEQVEQPVSEMWRV